MKAIHLIKNGKANQAFETRDIATPKPKAGEVQISVAAFGLNFADVMARKGMYQDAPPLPSVLGYDVAGVVSEIGEGVTTLKVGDRVTAMTRFGGYAEVVVTDQRAAAKIADNIDYATATALTTQYCTAYFAAAEMVNLNRGDSVLIHSGAGGVGSALIQYALHKGCTVFSTAGSDAKVALLQQNGVHYPINYNTQDFEAIIKRTTNNAGVDVIFDAVGGSYVRKGFNTLAHGGRIVCYGAADLSSKNIFGKLKAALAFGIYHPVVFMMNSKSMIGVNMLRIADNKQDVLQRCLKNVIELTNQGVFKPDIGKVFPVAELASAHEFLENRGSTGKIALLW